MSLSGRRRGHSASQNTQSTTQQEEVGDEEEVMTQGVTASQAQLSSRKYYERMDSSVQKQKITEMVRYLLCYQGKKTVLKRKELMDQVLGEHKRAFNEVFAEANKKLKSVFGLEAVEVYRTGQGSAPPPSGSRSYVLISTLPQAYTSELVQRSKRDRAEMGLLSVVLSLIMMKQGGISEEQLWNCLNRLGLSADSVHSTFGDVKKLITTDFVSKMYLDKEKVAAGDKHSITFRWGPRAEREVNKEEMLAYVAEIYGGDMRQWKQQFGDLLK